jgi:hypothetical protein
MALRSRSRLFSSSRSCEDGCCGAACVAVDSGIPSLNEGSLKGLRNDDGDKAAVGGTSGGNAPSSAAAVAEVAGGAGEDARGGEADVNGPKLNHSSKGGTMKHSKWSARTSRPER